MLGVYLLQGGCSSCPHATFRVGAVSSNNDKRLQELFDEHFRKVHVREDANESAARVVRIRRRIIERLEV